MDQVDQGMAQTNYHIVMILECTYSEHKAKYQKILS